MLYFETEIATMGFFFPVNFEEDTNETSENGNGETVIHLLQERQGRKAGIAGVHGEKETYSLSFSTKSQYII